MAIVHDLPTVNRGLSLTVTDTSELLIEIGAKETLSDFDVELWADLIRSQQSAGGFLIEIQNAAGLGVRNHAVLGQRWATLTAPPKRDYRKEQEDRRVDRENKRVRKFAKHRASFWPAREKIASGEDIGALSQIAGACRA